MLEKANGKKKMQMSYSDILGMDNPNRKENDGKITSPAGGCSCL
jgi:hypothetical protein